MVAQIQVMREDGQTVYRCSVDHTVLMREYENGAQVRGDSCPHFTWEPVGSGCYPDPQDLEICKGVSEIAQAAVLKVDQGSTIWFLVPGQ